MNLVRFHDEARAELVHEVTFYTTVNRRLGERFDKAVKSAINRAAEFPELGSPYFFGTRRVFPRKFHFSIVYLAIEAEVFIVAIAQPFVHLPYSLVLAICVLSFIWQVIQPHK